MINKRFYVAKSGDLAYLNVAKSGCTAIKVALSKIRDSSPEREGVNVHNPADYDLLFLDVVSPGSRLLDGIPKFTFVRNPVERALSFYRNKVLTYDENVTPHYEERGVRHGCDVNEFIASLVRIDPEDLEEHLYPQAHTVFEADGILVDWVGNLECMNDHWRDLMGMAGRDVAIRVANETRKDPGSRPSDKAMALLKEYYRLDGYCFGYYEEGPVTDEMKRLRVLFEEHRSGVATLAAAGGPDWQLVHRTYLESMHSQLAHLRRQMKGVNDRLTQLIEHADSADAADNEAEQAEEAEGASAWRKWMNRK